MRTGGAWAGLDQERGADPACQSAESLLEPLGMTTKDDFQIVVALTNKNAEGARASAFVKNNTHDSEIENQ